MSDPTKRPPEVQAELDKQLRNSATREQAKQRRLNGDERRGREHVTLDRLPLFADERSLSEAVLGRGKYTHWRAVVPLLEARGFPKIDGLMGGRYAPAVKAFFDREYRLSDVRPVALRDGPEDWSEWKKKRGRRTKV